MKGKNSSYK